MTYELTEEGHELCDGVIELRKEMSVSVAEFARLLGVADRSVQFWERHAHTPTGATLIRLKRLYEVFHEEKSRRNGRRRIA